MPQFFNQAQLSYNGSVINSNIAAGELVETLSVTKTAVADSYSRSDNVTYVVSIVNSGTAAFSSVTVTDDLGGYIYGGETLYPLSYTEGSLRVYVNGVLTAVPGVSAGPPLSVTGINVPAGGNVIIVYEAAVTGFAPLEAGSEIVNTVTVSGGGISVPITASETVSADVSPVLTVTKTIEPAAVTENGTVTYSFLIQNTGNTATVATDDVTLSDTFDPILENITVAYDGEVLTEGVDYTYDELTGAFSTVPGRLEVPAATFVRDDNTGAWIITPGVGILTVSGTI